MQRQGCDIAIHPALFACAKQFLVGRFSLVADQGFT
jgi:hypothetical protein